MMKIFEVETDAGNFLLKDGVVMSVEDQATIYYLVAKDKNAAIEMAKRFLAEEVGHSAKTLQYATRDDIGSMMRRTDESTRVKPVAAIIERLQDYIGSIGIDGALVVSPEHEDDMLIVALAEGEKKRVLMEPLYLMEQSEGGMQWGDVPKPLHVIHLAKVAQALF